MNEKKRTDVNVLGEFGLIEHLTSSHDLLNPSTRKGVGDDAAVLDYGGKNTVISTDMLVEGIHFDLSYAPLKHLGYKAVISNLSDICAMNVLPEHILVSIAFSNRFSVEAMEELYDGIYTACKYYDIDLIGGDTTSSLRGMVISITALGSADPGQIVYRGGASPGDILCVTGELGGAYLGLQLLEREKQIFLSQPELQPELEGREYILGKHLKPEARNDVVQILAKAELKPTSMIDLSDGLASDVFHLCKNSATGVLIEEAVVPIADETQLMAIEFTLDPITCALNGGEDYELLFTVSPSDLEKVRLLPGIFIIGEMKEESFGKKLLSSGGKMHDLRAQGWAHF